MNARSFLMSVVLSVCSASVAAPIGVGQAPPPITVESLSNGPAGLDRLEWDALEGRVVLLEFWGTWCGPCIVAIPHLNDLAEAVEDDERVVFFSVTYEDRETVEKFLEHRPMRAIIGHDTDRSFVDAFGIRSWPTTLIVREGEVVFRGRPDQVSADLLRSLAEPDADLTTLRDTYPALRPPADLGPWQFADHASVQVMVAPADHNAQTVMNQDTSGDSVRFVTLSRPIRHLLAAAWEIDAISVRLDPRVGAAREFRVIFHASAACVGHARQLLAAAMGVRVTESVERLAGYRVHVGDTEPSLTEPGAKGSATSVITSDGAVRISGLRVGLGQFFRSIERSIGRPIEVPAELARIQFKCDISVPEDPASAVAVIREELGLELEPISVDRKVLDVSPLETN